MGRNQSGWSPDAYMQVRELMERCINLLRMRLTLDSFEEIAMLADQVDDQGLYTACVEFVVRAWEEDRYAQDVCLLGSSFEICSQTSLQL